MEEEILIRMFYVCRNYICDVWMAWMLRVVCPMARWLHVVGRGHRGGVATLLCLATMVGTAKVSGTLWLQWGPEGVTQWWCVCSLPWGTCPMAMLGACVATGGQGGGTATLPCTSTMGVTNQAQGAEWP